MERILAMSPSSPEAPTPIQASTNSLTPPATSQAPPTYTGPPVPGTLLAAAQSTVDSAPEVTQSTQQTADDKDTSKSSLGGFMSRLFSSNKTETAPDSKSYVGRSIR